MDPIATTVDFIRNSMRQGNLSVEEAASRLRLIVPDPDVIERAVDKIREEGRKNQILKVPGGFEALEYKQLVGDSRRLHWYEGPDETDRHFPELRRRMLQGGLPADAVEMIDQSSTKVVAHLPDPGYHGLSKKGLVVGYVQSGKTANYASVLAKAADSGFRLLIVLSGIHNGLRQQTQRRLDRDLIEPHPAPWHPLTSAEADFGTGPKGMGILNSPSIRSLAVVKKNSTRLQRMVDWLEGVPEHIRLACPAIIIDDEADQATPNTLAHKQERSRINDLVRRLFSLLPSASYVGYTATPFANVLLDPSDQEELYPSHFIIDLPRPEGYFGAEQLFGRQALDDADQPDDGLDMVRTIPDDEAATMKPPRRRDLREAFDPPIGDCLADAINWFVLSVAARRARGQGDRHSSMLVHTSPYVAPQFALADRIRDELAQLRVSLDYSKAALHWEREAARVAATDLGEEHVTFAELEPHLTEVLQDMRVVVDNGVSEDRLDYGRVETLDDGTERPITETVIAVGGDTLSRGLTLEGLIVSYFIRNSNTYDTLLQMGRWFGFRKGYSDLPRIWVTSELRSSFRFLATVEAEIRQDMRRYQEEGLTPENFGVRIRTHPQLAITAASKMTHATRVNVVYGGKTLQTFTFDLSAAGEDDLVRNMDLGRALVRAARELGSEPERRGGARWVLRDVPSHLVIDFLSRYRFHKKHRDLDNDAITTYLGKRSDPAAEFWNVAVMGVAKDDGRPTIDLGLDIKVPTVRRARLKETADHEADIKAVMSRPDRIVDLDVSGDDDQALRRAHAGGRGLLLLYPIDRNSPPTTEARVELGASTDVLGLGIVFPSRVGDETSPDEAEYVSVTVTGAEDIYEDDLDETTLVDNEADFRPAEVPGDA